MRNISSTYFLFATLWPLFLACALSAQPRGEISVNYVYDGDQYSGTVNYIITHGRIDHMGTNQFSYDEAQEIIIRFDQLRWSVNTHSSDIARDVELSLESPSTNPPKVKMWENGGPENLKFKLGGALKEQLVIELFVTSKSMAFITTGGKVTLVFNRKETQKPPVIPPQTQNEPNPVSPQPEPVQSQEEKDWAIARTADSAEGYQEFLRKHKNSKGKFYKEAGKRLAKLSEIKIRETKQGDSLVVLTVSNLTKKPSIETTPEGHDYQLKKTGNEFEYEIIISLSRPGVDSIIINICDGEKPSLKKQHCIPYSVGNPLTGIMAWNSSKDSLFFVFSGGTPPYRVVFLLNNWDYYSIEVFGADTLLSWAGLKRDFVPGDYAVEIRDAGNFAYAAITEPALPSVKWEIPRSWLIVAGALALLFMVVFIIHKISSRKKQRRKEKMLRQVQENLGLNVEAAHPVNTTALHIDAEPESEKADQVAVKPGSSAISIRSRAGAKSLAADEFHQDIRSEGSYLPLYIDRLWRDSTVKTIFLHKESILEIDKFLRTENTSKIKENEKDIPEIGGMLMGRFTKDEANYFEVAIDKFVPIASKYSNVYSMEFSVESLAMDLTFIQDQFPKLMVVGWFHTHPGHGLFLSPPDLRIQEHFREPYQFAMEIDSLAENLDTGFFTRRPDGGVNNQEHLRPGARWFAWTEIEKFTRKRT